MKNQDTWAIANQVSTTWLLYMSLILFAVLIAILLSLDQVGIINWFGSIKTFFFIVAGLSTGLILVPIIITEYILKQTFTSDGLRK